jgi:hypothetical protein
MNDIQLNEERGRQKMKKHRKGKDDGAPVKVHG